jgi:hypothetical protein
MSLAIFAAPFDNHTETYTNNTNDSSSSSIIHKKRMQQQPPSSSHNKTQKKRENFDTQKVNTILEKIHNQTDSEDENDEYSSSLFQPPPNPESIGASKTKSTSSIFPNQGPQPANRNEHLDLNDIQNYGTPARAEEYYKKNIPNYEGQKQAIKQYPNYSNYSNYYKPSITTEPAPDVLMQKINYMISLLEEQKDEKTNNVTEEFILYSFLGIFIIYIVDAFARSGKYTR